VLRDEERDAADQHARQLLLELAQLGLVRSVEEGSGADR
jgi:hypothetical protein